MLTVEIKNDLDQNQENLINIEEETLIKMKTCFQNMVCKIRLDKTQIFSVFSASFIRSINSIIMV
jgi:hypothetical protein